MRFQAPLFHWPLWTSAQGPAIHEAPLLLTRCYFNIDASRTLCIYFKECTIILKCPVKDDILYVFSRLTRKQFNNIP